MPEVTSRKNIVFLSPFFFPEEISTGKYNTHLVKALQLKGHTVKVITSYPLYPDWVPKKCNDEMEGVELHRAGQHMRYPKSTVVRRIFLELWFAWHVFRNASCLNKNTELVIAIFPPVIFMMLVSFLLPKGVEKIGIVHDLLGVMAGSTKSTSRRVIARIMQSVESFAFNKCDRLICLSASMKDVLVNQYGVHKDKCVVQYPFVSLEKVEKVSDALADVFDDSYMHIVYSGALGEKQNPEKLLSFFTNLSGSNSDIVCHFFSRGPLFEQIKQNVNVNNIRGVRCHDLVPEEQLIELYDRSTVHIIPQAEGVGAGAFPSKLPNLLAFGVPVFAICDNDSELSLILNEFGIGKVVSSWDETVLMDEITHYLEEIKNLSHQELQEKFKASPLTKRFSAEGLVSDLIN